MEPQIDKELGMSTPDPSLPLESGEGNALPNSPSTDNVQPSSQVSQEHVEPILSEVPPNLSSTGRVVLESGEENAPPNSPMADNVQSSSQVSQEHVEPILSEVPPNLSSTGRVVLESGEENAPPNSSIAENEQNVPNDTPFVPVGNLSMGGAVPLGLVQMPSSDLHCFTLEEIKFASSKPGKETLWLSGLQALRKAPKAYSIVKRSSQIGRTWACGTLPVLKTLSEVNTKLDELGVALSRLASKRAGKQARREVLTGARSLKTTAEPLKGKTRRRIAHKLYSSIIKEGEDGIHSDASQYIQMTNQEQNSPVWFV